MALAALSALAVDFSTKVTAVALEPRSLLFNVADESPWGLGTGALILLAALTSILACILPFRVIAVGAGMALGGALGNLFSRAWWSEYGGSPDFILFHGDATGNVADLLIVAGLAAMLLGAVAWLGIALAEHHRETR
jgi:lipoprotein signal peptidase